MTRYYNKQREILQVPITPIGTGGEGNIFKIHNKAGYCVKIYHVENRTKAKEDKVDFLIHKRVANTSLDKFIVCYPIEKVTDISGRFVGFVMPLAFPDSVELYELVTLNIKKRLDPAWGLKYSRTTSQGRENRLKLCVNLAIAIHSLHSNGNFVLVDFKPQNVLLTQDARISITDIDSIQISFAGSVIHHGKVATPEYTPKEGELLDPAINYIPASWDRFSIAAVIYEILFGIHPYTATAGGQYESCSSIEEKIRKNLFVHGSKASYLSVIPSPHNYFHTLPNPLKNLFFRAFEAGSSDPNERPTAQDWGRAIFEVLSNGCVNSTKTRQYQSRPTSSIHSDNNNPYRQPGTLKKARPAGQSNVQSQHLQPQTNLNGSKKSTNYKPFLFLMTILVFIALVAFSLKNLRDQSSNTPANSATQEVPKPDPVRVSVNEQWENWFDDPNSFDGKVDPIIFKTFPSYITASRKNLLFIKLIMETPDPYFNNKNRLNELLKFNWDRSDLIDSYLKESSFKTSLLNSLKKV